METTFHRNSWPTAEILFS